MAPTLQNLKQETVWLEKSEYAAAEKAYYERQAKGGASGNCKAAGACKTSGSCKASGDSCKTPLADEVAKARQKLIEVKGTHQEFTDKTDSCLFKAVEARLSEAEKLLQILTKKVEAYDKRLDKLEKLSNQPQVKAINTGGAKAQADDEDDDDVDLFGSDSEDESAAKVREERLAAYNAKKSNKPALIAKSSIILDIKPWDDETDMKAMETEVRKVEMDGLLWGASKLVPLAYGIHKLQINCVVEDEKVSIDLLQETLQEIEDYIQSVDIAAFNKI